MRDQFLTKHSFRRNDAVQQRRGPWQRLQIGDAPIWLEHLQGRMIPDELLKWNLARPVGGWLLEGDRSASSISTPAPLGLIGCKHVGCQHDSKITTA